MKNVLVTIDFNTDEKRVIDNAQQFALAFGSKIWLMHVAAPDPYFVGYEVGPQYIRDCRAKELRKEHVILQGFSADLEKNGVEAEGLLIQGATVEMIMKEAKKLNIDLIITGHHDHGFLYKAFRVSVSSEIIKTSKIPLLLIPLM